MPTQRRSNRPAPLPPRRQHTTLPGRENYCHVSAGDHVSITGERGSYTVQWITEQGDLTCWGGPVGGESMRTFRPEQVSTVHRKPRPKRGQP